MISFGSEPRTENCPNVLLPMEFKGQALREFDGETCFVYRKKPGGLSLFVTNETGGLEASGSSTDSLDGAVAEQGIEMECKVTFGAVAKDIARKMRRRLVGTPKDVDVEVNSTYCSASGKVLFTAD